MNGEHKTGDGKNVGETEGEESTTLQPQDVASHPRMTAMEEISAANERRIHEQLVAEGFQPDFTPGEQPITPAPKPDPVEAATPPPPPAPSAEPAPGPSPQPTAAPKAPAAPAPASGLDAQLAAQLGREPVPIESLDHVQIRLKVDGKDRVTTVHELRRTAQLDGAALSRLEEANRLLAEARRTSKAPPAGTPPASPPVGVAPAAPASDIAPASKTAEVKSLVAALLVGDENQANEVLGKILGGPQQAPLDPASIARLVAPEVRQQLSEEEAIASFRSAYPEIVGDTFLANVADGHLAQVLAEEPQKPFAEALQDAGKLTREWLASKGVRTATEQPQLSLREQKLERKQQIDEVRGLNRTAPSGETPIPTASETIEQMRKERGLA